MHNMQCVQISSLKQKIKSTMLSHEHVLHLYSSIPSHFSAMRAVPHKPHRWHQANDKME